MKTVWTAGLDERDANDVIQSYNAGKYLRERLTALLKDRQELSRTDTLKKNNYESPSWALAQADAIGYQRALEEIVSLIS